MTTIHYTGGLNSVAYDPGSPYRSSESNLQTLPLDIDPQEAGGFLANLGKLIAIGGQAVTHVVGQAVQEAAARPKMNSRPSGPSAASEVSKGHKGGRPAQSSSYTVYQNDMACMGRNMLPNGAPSRVVNPCDPAPIPLSPILLAPAAAMLVYAVGSFALVSILIAAPASAAAK